MERESLTQRGGDSDPGRSTCGPITPFSARLPGSLESMRDGPWGTRFPRDAPRCCRQHAAVLRAVSRRYGISFELSSTPLRSGGRGLADARFLLKDKRGRATAMRAAICRAQLSRRQGDSPKQRDRAAEHEMQSKKGNESCGHSTPTGGARSLRPTRARCKREDEV